MNVAELIEGRHVCVCAGAGGVGKTTTAAAIAIGMAARGLKVAVLTIDPAKRLASSLGLSELANEERRIEPELFERHGIEMRGELWAMMLDAKRTWDELIERRAPDRATRDAILGNRIYQQLSWRSSASTSCTRSAATTSSCSTRRRLATRSTSSTRRTGSRASSTRARSRSSFARGCSACARSGAGPGWCSACCGGSPEATC